MIDRIFDKAARGLELALALAFIGIVLLNFINVVGRHVFGQAILWADELEVFVMIAATFLGSAIVTWRRQHLRMDVLSNLLPAPLRALRRWIELILMLGICGFVARQALDYSLKMYAIGRTSDAAGVPMWIPHASVVAGFGLIVLVCLWQILRSMREGFGDGRIRNMDTRS